MDIAWFRDLSITILGFVTSVVLIFITVLIYRLYHMTISMLSQVKAASKIVYDVAALVQECLKPLIPVLAFIQGIRNGFKGFSNIFNKESNEGEKGNE